MVFLLLEAAAIHTALFGIKKKQRRKSIFTFAVDLKKKPITYSLKKHPLSKA